MLLVYLVLGLYAFVVLKCLAAWNQLPKVSLAESAPPAFFSVIIPVRNEATNITALLQDLERQQYPKNAFEVLVIDDHSEDATPILVRQFQAQSSLSLTLLSLASFPGKKQKKGAVEVGIQAAQGEWIACTDGDCRVSPNWLLTLNQVRQEQESKFISGPVQYAPTQSIWQQVQALEFSALIGVGAASISLQKPTMCNGANLAYEKAAFYAVNGFAGNEQIPSGDDEFLLHKIHQRFPGKVAFAKAREAVVLTPPAATVTQFFHQRIRWASKWKHYETLSSRLLALLVLAANLAVVGGVGASVLGFWPWWGGALGLLLKLGADGLLLYHVLGFFGKKTLLWHLIVLQMGYGPYILLTALFGLKGNYAWKGRQLTTA
ncbi:glycosyltransferase [Rufibacter soli]